MDSEDETINPELFRDLSVDLQDRILFQVNPTFPLELSKLH